MLAELEKHALILELHGWDVDSANLNEDLDYFTLAPPTQGRVTHFQAQREKPKDERLFNERPRRTSKVEATLKKTLRTLEASVQKNSLMGSPSKHRPKKTLEPGVVPLEDSAENVMPPPQVTRKRKAAVDEAPESANEDNAQRGTGSARKKRAPPKTKAKVTRGGAATGGATSGGKRGSSKI